ncbi:MAG TPA: carbon storage regulator CsrA [Spirochaetota bacterium]|jgi:carbon storage regulator|nr:MAG: hypothetical protein BWX91_02047 [Spirochaetes bacterium ADurb.Bin133]HNZ26775.1 carbon storage regulator CsrA [Spirochaetota bacterium]HOF01664.1 carbon storage regulator CsrA [Spirochaetota bacterium]HOS56591.1 carbon storage regulator CsrA [Spirochaetota bacterium]HPK61927.1 carbon storage regulator CsrA [Spirochaetota bacterium]
MLILARKENQSIMIGEDIEISILNIKGDHVKIGIDAPSDVKVYRKEVFEEIQAANIEAVKTDLNAVKNIGTLFKNKK